MSPTETEGETVFSLHSYDVDSNQEVRTELRFGHSAPLRTIKMACLDGATSIQLPIYGSDGKQAACYEVDARAGEVVHLFVSLMSDGTPWIEANSRKVLSLQCSKTEQPIRAPLVPAPQGEALDLAIVVDATTIARPDPDPGPAAPVEKLMEQLLANKKAWTDHVVLLVALAKEISSKHTDPYLTTFAFADFPSSSLDAEDLDSGWALYPEDPDERSLESRSSGQLRRMLLDLPYTSGGDFVDALAEAVAAAADLNWREDARKVFLLFGNSPGHSVLTPAPEGANMHDRILDLDTQVEELHARGVEILTIFHDLPRDSSGSAGEGLAGEKDPFFARPLVNRFLEYAQDQYRRLASRDELAWVISHFDVKDAAGILLENKAVGRTATLGQLIEVQ